VKTHFFGNVPQENQYVTPPKMSKFGVFTQSGALLGLDCPFDVGIADALIEPASLFPPQIQL
jgi:hypothetical protein